MLKIVRCIWCVSIKALLLHPLSGTRAAIDWHSDSSGVGNASYFFLLGLFFIQIKALKKKNEKKLLKTFGSYAINFLPLHPLSERKQRELTFWRNRCKRSSLVFPPFRIERRREETKETGIWKKLPKTFGVYRIKFLPLHPLSEKRKSSLQKRSLNRFT